MYLISKMDAVKHRIKFKIKTFINHERNGIRSVEKLPEHEVYGVIQQDVRVAVQNVMSNEQIINTLANYGQYIKPEN